MKFGEALSYLEDGKCVSRNIWKAGEFIENYHISHYDGFWEESNDFRSRYTS